MANQKQQSEMPKCPACGRRSTVRRLEPETYFCSHCNQAFTTRGR